MSCNDYEIYKEIITKRCSERSDKIAITYMREADEITTTTFTEMLNGHREMAKLLSDAGIICGDRVALISPHSPQGVLTALGLAYNNVTTVLIDASLPACEINRLLKFSDVRGVFTTKRLYSQLDNDAKKEIPFFELCSKENKYEIFSDSVSRVQKSKTKDPEKDVIAILFSSGTTAQMKGIKVTYASVMKASEIFIRNVKWKAEYNYFHVFPLNHIAGYATVHAFLSCGSELGMIENMNATKLQEALLKYEPHSFGMIPKVFEMMEEKIRQNIRQKGVVVEKIVMFMLAVSSFFRKYLGVNVGLKMFRFITRQVFGRNIIAIGTGASLCKESTSKFFIDMGLMWANFYASTETNVPAVSTGAFDRYPVLMAGNINRNPEIEIKINNPDSDGVGEIYIKSELVMKGYFREDELTKQSFDGDFFKTGDYGYVDKHQNLFVTGRVKESILLHSGKKISPTDVENYYNSIVGGEGLVCCGYQKENENYDEVHIFVQTAGKSEDEVETIIEKIQKESQKANNLYKLDAVHRIEKVSMTTVGKVKRFELQELIKNNYKDNNENKRKMNMRQDVGEQVIAWINSVTANDVSVSLDSNLHNELGLDSLQIYELDTQLQITYGISVVEEWINMNTVRELIDYIQIHRRDGKKEKHNNMSTNVIETNENKLIELFGIFDKICDVEYRGAENLLNEACIYAPNHSSHLDTIAIYKAVHMYTGDRMKKMCCLAAKELTVNERMKDIFNALGAIPVERTGNTTVALKMLNDCITKKGYSALVFPEGTRTRTGKMGKFLNGTASASIRANVPVTPVGIVGTFDIWPPNCEKPKISAKRKKIVVTFGKPIYPEGKDVNELTESIRGAVEALCKENIIK